MGCVCISCWSPRAAGILSQPASHASRAAMVANGHQDVDVPASLLPELGTLLDRFRDWLIAERHQVKAWRVPKPSGGHVTPWWLYVELCPERPAQSRVVFGETDHAKAFILCVLTTGHTRLNDQTFASKYTFERVSFQKQGRRKCRRMQRAIEIWRGSVFW